MRVRGCGFESRRLHRVTPKGTAVDDDAMPPEWTPEIEAHYQGLGRAFGETHGMVQTTVHEMKGETMSEREDEIVAPEGETLPLPVADDAMPAEEADEDDDEGDDATEEATEPDA